LLAASAIATIAAIVVLTRWVLIRSTNDAGLVYYDVIRTSLDISVTERGNLESQLNERVLCEVEDVQSDGINGTPIVWIVDNGASVKEGDLIVELESTMMQDRLDEQVLDVEEAKSKYVQAKVQYENQIDQNETNLAEAELAVELAELALKQYEDDDGGTFQIELEDVELSIQEAEAGELIQQTNLTGVEQLYKLGYRSSGELAEARLNALRAERTLANALSKRKELVEYRYKKMKMELEGAMQSSKRALRQVRRDNDALLAQAKARFDAAQESLSKESELLARYEDQLKKCKIYAPQDGMIAYASGQSRYREEIRPGAAVRRRQPIMNLPNLKRMQVKTSVHESVLDQIDKGLDVSIRVDAFPDRHYQGSVQSVAVLPDQGGWFSSDTKVYPTVVTIDEDVEQLKPGMTAVVEIHVDYLEDVVAVPIQAIMQVEGETWCYVDAGGEPERRCIQVGKTNDKFVEIRDGIQEGERVVLNPHAVMDQHTRSSDKTDEVDTAIPEQPELAST
jgi:RND family efflux transporter MFP subunit